MGIFLSLFKLINFSQFLSFKMPKSQDSKKEVAKLAKRAMEPILDRWKRARYVKGSFQIIKNPPIEYMHRIPSKKEYRLNKWLYYNMKKWNEAKKKGDVREAERRYFIWIGVLSRRHTRK